jgi:hypothetical protein
MDQNILKRRQFLAAAGIASIGPLAGVGLAAESGGGPAGKQLFELRLYRLASPEKRKQLVDFFAKAGVPALNRAGVKPVGLFEPIPEEGQQTPPDLFVLLPHCGMESVVALNDKLMADEEFLKAGAAVLDAPPKDPAYERIESSLLEAFDGMPEVACPASGDERVFQLRIYEAHSVQKGQKKIEMFNTGGELDIFAKVGLTPVFFGEALIGTRIPNLTYLLGFENIAAKDAAWKAFLAHPDWAKLKADPQYADTVSRITNIMLRPAAGSQV